MSFNVVITGSRDWPNDRLIEREVNRLLERHGLELSIAHGNARGADRMAARVAGWLGVPVTPYPVDQALDGPWPAAGHRRNRRMVDAESPSLVLAFQLGRTPGTQGCIDYALDQGHPVRIVRPNGDVEEEAE